MEIMKNNSTTEGYKAEGTRSWDDPLERRCIPAVELLPLSSEEVNITEISLYPKDSFPHKSFTIE